MIYVVTAESSQLGDSLSCFRRHAPLTLALKNRFARGFKDFLCFRKLDVTVRVPIALQAQPEQYVQDVYGHLMIIADRPLNLSLEYWVASSVSGIACFFNNQMWFVCQLPSRHGMNNLCRMCTET
jgi:hypothetical protein